jgi:hypothetical protein
MTDHLGKIKGVASSFGKELLSGLTPRAASGLINELFHQWSVDVPKITQYVQQNRSLWDGIEPDRRRQLGGLAKKVGSLDFITPDFLVDSIKRDFPAVASLFLNWPEAGEWLARQIDDLKKQVSEIE